MFGNIVANSFSVLPSTCEFFLCTVEVYLIFSISVILIWGTFIITASKYNFPIFCKAGSKLILLTIFYSFLLSLDLPNINNYIFNKLFLVDALSINIKTLILMFSFFFVLATQKFLQHNHINSIEYFTILLLGILSSFFLIQSYSLLSLYLSLEMQSLSLYILGAFKRQSMYSNEAGLKYFITGAFSSGFLLLGFSLLYFYTGCNNYLDLYYFFDKFFFPSDIFYSTNVTISDYFTLYNNGVLSIELFLSKYKLLTVILLLLLAGFLFKLAAFPFHFWVADVYEGAPSNSTLFFMTVSKLPLIYSFYKLFNFVLIEFFEIWGIIVLFSGVFSIVWGSLLAFKQYRIKKLLAYSSIGQTGYLLLAMVGTSLQGSIALYFFLVVYLLSTVLIWTSILTLYYQKYNFHSESLVILSGLKNSNSILSFIIIFSLLSIAGIPFLPGFVSKMLVFLAFLKTSMYSIMCTVIFISVLSAYYYLKIIKNIFFEKRAGSVFFNNINYEEACAIAILFLLLVLLIFFPNFLIVLSYKLHLSLYY